MTTPTTGAGTRVPILMYHEIAPPEETTSRLAVTPEAFADQLDVLDEEGFRAVTAAEVADAFRRHDTLPDRAVVLTFDDGYADFHRRALPLLDKHGFAATVFVTSGWVADSGCDQATAPPGPMLSWPQIEEAMGAGIEIAAHTRGHPQLDRLPWAELERELSAGRVELEDRLGRAVTGLAYPFGYFNHRVTEAASRLGYDYGCAVRNAMAGRGSDPFALPRLTVARSTGLSAFRQLVRGEHLGRHFLKARAMTKGWTVVRRSWAAVGRAGR